MWGLASEGAMGSGEIVEALPLMELGIEEFGVVDHFAGQEPMELFVVDAMRPFVPVLRNFTAHVY